MGDSSSGGEAEFDSVAGWTADAVAALGEDHAIAAACRGSGSPAALAWLGDAMRLDADAVLLDVGAGVGGPSAWARQELNCRTTLVEPMIGACEAAGRLFGLPVVAGRAEALPCPSGRARHVWCLGVLSAAEDIGRAVAELARVLHPDGVLGLLAFVRTRTPLTGEPTGTHFPAPDELSDHLGEHGLVVTGWTDLDAVARAPAAWDAQAARVERWIADHHGGEPAWRSAREDERRVADLIDGGAVVGQLLVVHPSSPRG